MGANGFDYIYTTNARLGRIKFLKGNLTMMKNKMMRIASVLLVAVLFSTCAISGTFAKYVSTANSSDTARVAKWGVAISVANNSNFKSEYGYDTTDVTDNRNSNSAVLAFNATDKLVAPGTKSGTAENDGIVFTISGRPEVATKIDITMDVTKDVFVKGADGVAVYEPVKFTLKQLKGYDGNAVSEDDVVLVNGGTLSDVEKVLEAYAATAYYKADSDLDATFQLTWEWVFGDNTNDANDTLLGNLAAGTVTGYTEVTAMPTVGENGREYTNNTYSDDINFTINFVIKQVD